MRSVCRRGPRSPVRVRYNVFLHLLNENSILLPDKGLNPRESDRGGLRVLCSKTLVLRVGRGTPTPERTRSHRAHRMYACDAFGS